MRNTKYSMLAGALALVMLATPASAGGYFTNGVPPAGGTQYPTTIPLTGAETIPADTNLSGGANPQSEAISISQLSGYMAGRPSLFSMVIGGDAGTNLFQRGTTGSSVTTTATYGGPDRFFYWSGTGTAMTVSRDSTAGDIPPTYQYAFKMARTSGQTGVVQVCMAQEIASVNSYLYRGQTVELDFYATTGADFSAASNNMTAYVVYGTGTDDGSSKMAFGLNAGGGGASAWTGQANATAAVIGLGADGTQGRYAAVATIPATATEVGIALCYTPVGTASTNDYIAFAGIQLVRNPSLASLVSTTVGYSSANVQLTSFQRRPAGIEASMQYSYFYRLNEPASTAALPGTCQAVGASTNICNVFMPVPMFATVPTITITTAGTFKVNIAGTPTTIATPTASVCSRTACAVTAGNTNTAGQVELLSGGGGTGAWDISAEL